MLVLSHIDWNGTNERLLEYDEAEKKACEKTEGAEYLGRFMPWNKKYHWTSITKVKDISTFQAMMQNLEWDRDYKEITHGEAEFYAGPFPLNP
ncbi:hypothetical protein ES703_69070 [subsurface metagenome]